MARPDVQLICFDLGRVLVRICDGWQEACCSAGVPLPETERAPQLLKQLSLLAQQYELGAVTCERFFREVAALTGLGIDQARAAWGAWTCSPYPNVEALLDRLRQAGYRLACLSNTNANHWQIFHDRASHCFFPMQRFDYRFASHLVGAAKPEPAIYAHVEQQTGLGPGQIVFFDDLLPNVTAAQSRGWNAFQITPDVPPPDQITRRLVSLGVL